MKSDGMCGVFDGSMPDSGIKRLTACEDPGSSNAGTLGNGAGVTGRARFLLPGRSVVGGGVG